MDEERGREKIEQSNPGAFPDNYREVSFSGITGCITIRSTFPEETVEYLLDKAMTSVIVYEDENLKDKVKKNLKFEDAKE